MHRSEQCVELTEGVASYRIYLPQASTDYIQKKITLEKNPYELAMLQDIQSRLQADDLVLDIGANIGNHSLFMAAVVGCKVIAFEPNLALVEALQHSVKLNNLEERITIHAMGLGKTKSCGHFASERPDNLGAQSIELGSGDLQIIPLDSLNFEQSVKLLKIDVEGMELDVLQGALALLHKDRPIIYVECMTENEFKNVATWLSTLNYCYWETFNATPTHLFLPDETVNLKEKIEHQQHQVILSSYREIDQLKVFKQQVNDANLKYRNTCEQITQLKNSLSKTNVAYQHSQEQVHEAKSEVQRYTEQYNKLRASLTYQLGYQIKIAFSSLRSFLNLPMALWSIYKSYKVTSENE